MIRRLDEDPVLRADALALCAALHARGTDVRLVTECPHSERWPALHYRDVPILLTRSDDVLIYYSAGNDAGALEALVGFSGTLVLRVHDVASGWPDLRTHPLALRQSHERRRQLVTMLEQPIAGVLMMGPCDADQIAALSSTPPDIRCVLPLSNAPAPHHRIRPRSDGRLVVALLGDPAAPIEEREAAQRSPALSIPFDWRVGSDAHPATASSADLLIEARPYGALCQSAMAALSSGTPCLVHPGGNLHHLLGDEAATLVPNRDLLEQAAELLFDERRLLDLSRLSREAWRTGWCDGSAEDALQQAVAHWVGAAPARELGMKELVRQDWFGLPDLDQLLRCALDGRDRGPAALRSRAGRRAFLAAAFASPGQHPGLAAYLDSAAIATYAFAIRVPAKARRLSSRGRLVWRFDDRLQHRVALDDWQGVAKLNRFLDRLDPPVIEQP